MTELIENIIWYLNTVFKNLHGSTYRFRPHHIVECEIYSLGKQLGFTPLTEVEFRKTKDRMVKKYIDGPSEKVTDVIRTIIDVVWLKDNNIVYAFQIETQESQMNSNSEKIKDIPIVPFTIYITKAPGGTLTCHHIK